ncbi:glycerate kinase [Paenibacillus pectinilyticus]|uniref:Glycerate kinase n=1 Tax=Paenibacillus pectinilyticus TaxID=512399 RepID=A0A1C0ZVA6_9BACL|nr:glycerate kinase [Paenibacillus pectinilyticus]OCT12043.1 glycerate kinase [Paenibacillus pectinilyticus]
MRFVVAPDSFKGSLSAAKAGEVMTRAILLEMPDASVKVVPMADGGEGTVETLVSACNGKFVPLEVTGPLGELTETYYGLIDSESDGKSKAIIEAANIFGLTMVPMEHRNPLHTTTIGMGQVIRHVLDQGIRSLVIGLGGSSTNDGGLGMLAALGVQFKDQQGQLLPGFGRDLEQVAFADFSGLDTRLTECEIIVASDVINPLCGINGATYVYGPQKGATSEMVVALDEAMSRYAEVVETVLVNEFRHSPGAGAAGGLGFALLAIGAQIVPGAQLVGEMTKLKDHIRATDWVLTGEGKSDNQTLFGKLPYCVAQWAKEADKKVLLISGSIGEAHEELYDMFTACFSIIQGPSTLELCIAEAEQNLFDCTRNIIRMLNAMHTLKSSEEVSR